MEFQKNASQRTNVQQIIQCIIDNGPISRRALQQYTGFSWGLISQVTYRLIVEGLIVAEEELLSAGVGRRAERLDIVSYDNFYIGIDIDCDGIYAVVTDMKGRVIENRHDNWFDRTQSAVLHTLYEILDTMMEKFADKHITRIGVSVQGTVDMARGVSSYIDGIKNWVDIPLRDLLVSRYDVDVVVAHDTDCLMESECAFGILKNTNVKDVIMMNYNYRIRSIGMFVMTDGNVYFGHRGRAAEIGYVILGETPDGNPLMLGNYMMNPEMTEEQISVCVGKAMAIANTMYNPEIVVLHIPDCPYGEQMANTIEHWIRTGSYDPTVSVKMSKLGRNAQARGAAMIMINRTIDEMM